LNDALQRDAHDAFQNENVNSNETFQRDAHDAFQNENVNSNETFQRDAHVGTSLRGRPVDQYQCFTNENKINNDEKRGRSVDENQCFTNGQIKNDENRGRSVDENQCFTNGKIDDQSMNTSKYGQHNKIYGASISLAHSNLQSNCFTTPPITISNITITLRPTPQPAAAAKHLAIL
jgi:hypothetical protein